MIFKGLIAAASAVALAAAPAVAASNAPAALAPAEESVDGSELGGGSAIVVILAIVAVGLGIWALVDDGDDAPVSP